MRQRETSLGRGLTRLKTGLKGSHAGHSLVEVLMAVAILGTIGVTFLTAMATGSTATLIANERATAESLSQGQLEYVVQCEYDDTSSPPQYEVDSDMTIPPGYSVEVVAERLDPFGDGTADDDGIQKITAQVYHDGKPVAATEGYKARHE